MFFQNGKPENNVIVPGFSLWKYVENRFNNIQKNKFSSNLFLNTPGAIGRYSRPSSSGAMGTMCKNTEWNGTKSFLNILKSEWKDSKGLHDLAAATCSCTRGILLRVQNFGTAGFRTWTWKSGNREKSGSPKLEVRIRVRLDSEIGKSEKPK